MTVTTDDPRPKTNANFFFIIAKLARLKQFNYDDGVTISIYITDQIIKKISTCIRCILDEHFVNCDPRSTSSRNAHGIVRSSSTTQTDLYNL